MSLSLVKVCGLTRQEDVLFAESMGAWALGFIFYPKSPRYIEPARVEKLIAINPEVLRVGVFVNASQDEIVKAVKQANLSGIQLHGDESPEFCSELKNSLKGVALIKAFRLKSEDELSLMAKYSMCDAKLVDAFVEGQPGGTGRIAAWDLAEKAKPLGRLILSGGLTSDNISQAFAQVKPRAFDVSSGVEDSPGIKNHAKIRAFFQTLRSYESQ